VKHIASPAMVIMLLVIDHQHNTAQFESGSRPEKLIPSWVSGGRHCNKSGSIHLQALLSCCYDCTVSTGYKMANGVNRRKKGRLFRASSSSVQTNTNKVKCSSSDYCGTDALPAVTGHKWPISLEGASRTSRWLVLAARQG
jgi:hypothetical protein